ncbi:AAA family ATPase [Candidatus Woesearchaeota archaeon]|nr:AAA family ATPase [Candidatus Woesearchaeota archaeon]
MALFKDMLSDSESLFLNEVALDYDFLPKKLPYRETQQEQMALCIKPLLVRRNGRNLFIYGTPGIGKTAACKKVLEELEEETDEVLPVYLNCWQHNTTYKIVIEICNVIGYRLTMNKKTNELMNIVIENLNKLNGAVLVFDEIDKAEDLDFLYTFLEKLYRKSIFLISNNKEDVLQIDDRIKSRLNPEMLEFEPYNFQETEGILNQRKDFAFVKGVWSDDAFDLVVAKTFDLKDIRKGLHLLREAGNIAEQHAKRKIELDHAKKSIAKLDEFFAKDKEELTEDEKKILELIKLNPNHKIGDLFKQFQDSGSDISYKSFQRRIEKLEKGKFISAEKTKGGKEGNTKILSVKDTQLTDF